MNKLDMIYDMMVEQRDAINSLSDRVVNIEQDISELKQFKAKITGMCLVISGAIGLVPSVLKYLS